MRAIAETILKVLARRNGVSRSALAVFPALIALAALGGEKPAEAPVAGNGLPKPKPEPPKEQKLEPGTYAHVKTAKGEIVVRLLADKAPKTVANFVELAKGERPWKDKDGRWVAKPFYNGLTFHRIENGVLKLILGGCPKGDGTGGPGYKFEDELGDDLKFDKPGRVAMENSGPNTNGSQFFITLDAAPSLDKRYSIFGEVVRGLDVAEAISKMPAEARGTGDDAVHVAKEPVAIQTVEIKELKAEEKPQAK
jgi:peptidyl-prolyl cis-trans isomerase A (cyclophilin A)